MSVSENDVEKVDVVAGDLIVVGSSAGGVEALSILVGTLPLDFPAPIVLAQHLDPAHPSTLDMILQRRTRLPVEVVTSSTQLQNGYIYVVPSNRHVSIHDHHVEVFDDRAKRPRPSVDTLLSTASESYGDHLIAVILTGSGSDGAVGAVDVKNAGGTVIVQDPQTARYPSMPLALPPTVVDFEVNIDQIGPLLYDLLTGVNIPQTEERTEDILREILGLVSRQASIDFRPYKTSTILRRISRRMTVTHNRSMREYADYLKISPEEVGQLVKAFLINVTQFFRDSEAFAYLKNEIMPTLIANARGRDRVLRFWAAGCATGEEPYSLAMLITDLLGVELPEWSVKIFATDLDEAAINFARRGLYSDSMLKGMPTEYRDRFFERVDHGYRISKTLRQMIIFGQQDLSRSAPFPRIDLVLCRNVLIYFTPELQEYVLNQFAFSLSPSGYLFLGKAETVRAIQSFYELVNKQWKVYRCTGNALPSMRRQTLMNMDMNASHLDGATMNRQPGMIGKQPVDQDLSAPSLEIGQLHRFNELLLRFLPIGIVVIDRAYRILTANGAARRLLGLRHLSAEQDFLHAVRGIPYYETRAAIDSAFRDRSTTQLLEIELDASAGGNGRYISFSISFMSLENGNPDLATICVTDVTQQVQVRQQLETVQAEQIHLMNELSTANKRLSEMNKELVDANEELQVSNEELVLTHEELQASIEEFETTNEELQATNEELETNNEELQATNEELETTNDELRARTGELQELTSILESERRRLSEMVELAPFYILVLRGPTLIVEAYNPRYARLLNARAVQGRPLDEVLDLFWESGVEIVHRARDAYRLDMMLTTPRMLTHLPQRRDSQGEQQEYYFTYTIVPSHDANGKVDGVIIYTLDETEQRWRAMEEERERLKLIFQNFSTAALALFDAETGALMMGSPRYLDIVSRLRNLSPQSLIGRRWHDITFIMPDEQIEQLWQQVVEERAPVRIPELSSRPSPDAEEIIWDYNLTPLLDQERNDVVRFVLVSAVEVTEQVQARKELEQLDTMKDEFFSLVTHELRNPLTTIQGNAQLLLRTLQRQYEAEEQGVTRERNIEQEQTSLNRIIHQTSRMRKLIEEMLDVPRIHRGMFALHDRETVDIVALVREVVEQIASSDHILLLEADEQPIQVSIDVSRIEQVLYNLISNALKYSPAATKVTVTVAKSTEQPGEVVVSVHDEGSGIGEEEQKHIFERFYRGHRSTNGSEKGLGLGLYISHEIILQQGGRMWLESTPGDGSTFYFSLPAQ
jgi:two-component system, chemotaxis family, CheB/CheR fusion protein